jgi:3'-phosphoadenosine 5'-phosphosulfate sulfotransferase (PAPS reductase)/FAD synthetase
VEYVKYLTDNINDFPLVITSVLKPTDLLLSKNGCPTHLGKVGRGTRRWCTRIWKTKNSKEFYKEFDLNGITQLLGNSRFHGERRAKQTPIITISDKLGRLKKPKQKTYKGKTEDEVFDIMIGMSNFDEEGFPVDHKIKEIDRKKKIYQIRSSMNDPKHRVYQAMPNFDYSEEKSKKIMEQAGIKISPIIKNFSSHGCMMCTYRPAAYYQTLRRDFPDLYEIVNKWRKMGKFAGSKDKGKQYFYFYNPAEGTKMEIYKKKPENFYLKDPSKPLSEENLEPIF